jgi:hypothetical protein
MRAGSRCPFHNAAVEAADAMPVEDIVHEHKRTSLPVSSTATEAGARDPHQPQPARRFEGAAALANDTSPCYTRSAAETLIDAATIDSGK